MARPNLAAFRLRDFFACRFFTAVRVCECSAKGALNESVVPRDLHLMSFQLSLAAIANHLRKQCLLTVAVG